MKDTDKKSDKKLDQTLESTYYSEYYKYRERKLNCIFYTSLLTMTTSISVIIFVMIKMFYNNDIQCTNNDFIINNSNIMFVDSDHSLYPMNYNNISKIVLDDYYYNLEKNNVEKILLEDRTNLYNYKTDVFDCDDFSILLLSTIIKISYLCSNKYRSAFGLLTGYSNTEKTDHMLNFFIDKKFNFWCVEPQNDTIFMCNETNIDFNYLLI